jgi:hypothetical protein
MWVAICVPLVIGATALLMQRVEACLDRSQVGLATVAHAPNPRPPVDLDLDPAPALACPLGDQVFGGAVAAASAAADDQFGLHLDGELADFGGRGPEVCFGT